MRKRKVELQDQLRKYQNFRQIVLLFSDSVLNKDQLRDKAQKIIKF